MKADERVGTGRGGAAGPGGHALPGPAGTGRRRRHDRANGPQRPYKPGGTGSWRTLSATPPPSPPPPAVGTSPPAAGGSWPSRRDQACGEFSTGTRGRPTGSGSCWPGWTAVAVMYRLAATLADAAGDSPRFRWYRSDPLDAAVALPGGRTLGVIRQGATVDRTAFSDRVGRLLDPGAGLTPGPAGAAARRGAPAPGPPAPGPLPGAGVPGYRAGRGPLPGRRPGLAHTLRRHRPRPPAGPGPPRTRRIPAGGARPVQGVPTG